MAKKFSDSFYAFTALWMLGMFVTNLLSLIFSCKNPKASEAFKEVEVTDFSVKVNYNFLMDLKFGEELPYNDNYGIAGNKEERCYIGSCITETEIIKTYNCSYACLHEIRDCYNGEELCRQKKCDENRWATSSISACITYNIINKWRNTEMIKSVKSFGVYPLKQIIPKNGNCQEGYKKCGKINENDDYLCLSEDYDCPINSIIIKLNDNPPSSKYRYTSYKLGNNYLFYTNENINGYIVTDLLVNFDNNRKPSENYAIIDIDSIINFLLYNPLVTFRSYNYPSEAYLNQANFVFNYTYQEMKKKQEEFLERIQLYTKDDIEIMNLEVEKYKYLLMGFSIASFAVFFLTAFYFLPIYNCGEGCSKCKCSFCKNLTPIKIIIHLYLAFLPTISFCIVDFIFTIQKMMIFNKYLSMKYINEYKNTIYLEKSINFNYRIFICLLIALAITIIYPILVKITSPKIYNDENIVLDPLKKENNETNNCPVICNEIPFESNNSFSPGPTCFDKPYE